ncbi:tyrosine-type recombinase/integrase [Rubritalea spongiae]|uniref:Tyrosine-type recombinase/integrase n=1 Tax=Rubritalea spongiae TaxID=430797 RepID=A0ABW5E3W4_9BACT
MFKQKGSRNWYAGWKNQDGKRVNRSTGLRNTQGNRRKAQKMADEFEDASKNMRAARKVREVISEFHQELTGQEIATRNVRQYCDQFINMKRGEVSESTIGHYTNAFNTFCEWLGGRAQEDINNVRREDVASYRNHLLESVSASTASKKVKAARAMFRAAMTEGLILEDPTLELKLGVGKHAKAGNKRAFTIVELKKILAEAHGEWKSMVLFGLYTGQRLGDLSTLRWSAIDLERGEVRIITRKTGAYVVVPMSTALRAHIESLEFGDDPEGFIHPELGDIYDNKSSTTLSNQFSGILARCGLREPVRHSSKEVGRDAKRQASTVGFHSLRYTAISLLHDAGIPEATVKNWVGHESSEVHKGYIKTDRESLQRASDALPEGI